MRAIVVHEPGGPEVLQLEERPVPQARPGWVVVRIRAFGLNRSELGTRAGHSGDAVRFPRVLGIECVGEVVEDPSGGLAPGQAFVAAMGGMGRDFDGGYEEHALLPVERVVPVRTTLPWEELGAIPESFGTAWGTLAELDLGPGRSLLVHGATSSVGMAGTTLAKARGVTVVATTRQEAKRSALAANGADHVVVADGPIAAAVREAAPDGVDGLCELVGPDAMVEALEAVKPGGRACITGYLEERWEVDDAEAQAQRLGVAFARFGSFVLDRERYGDVFQEIVDGVEAGRYRLNLDRVFPMEQIAEAHRYMEANRAAGKVVVTTES